MDSPGDFFPPRLCNCACQRCLSGSCCMWPDVTPATPVFRTYATTGAGVTPSGSCLPYGHWFAPYPTGGLFCQRCGEFRQPRTVPANTPDGVATG
jgi:hypothetical protein